MNWHEILLKLTALAPLQASILIIAFPTALAIAATILLRRSIGYEKLASNNELAGVKFGIVALTYVMILTFATLSAWEKFSVAQASVTEEAAAAGAIYIIAGHESKETLAVQEAVKSYVAQAVTIEWPTMETEKADQATAEKLKNLYKAASALDKVSNATTQLAAEIFKHIDKINEMRQSRITLSAGIVPDLVWFVLVLGAIITISFTLFFGTPNIFAQIMMTGMTTAMLLMALLVIVSFDHPFTGVVHVGSTPLQLALDEMHD